MICLLRKCLGMVGQDFTLILNDGLFIIPKRLIGCALATSEKHHRSKERLLIQILSEIEAVRLRSVQSVLIQTLKQGEITADKNKIYLSTSNICSS